MDKNIHKYGIKQLLSYVSKLKSPWSVAVFNPKTKKRAVGESLPQAMKKLQLKDDAQDVVVLDHKTSELLLNKDQNAEE
jgi:hypothetical protein